MPLMMNIDAINESASPEIFIEPPVKVMITLPETFKSLVDTPIDITDENRNPQDVIKLLGEILAVTDYKTNIASFWFLDFIALQVLHHDATLDSHGRSVMVSWLAGEMKLIQDKKLSRDAFFQEMAEIFIDCSEKLACGQVVQHWDVMLAKKLKEEIPVPKKLNDGGKDLTIPKNNSHNILDVIMEATYSMYGSSFHYALIVAAFVKPVLLHEYILPFALRTPRPVKAFEVEKDDKKATKKGQDSKKTKRRNSKAGQTIETTPKPPTPVTVTEEEILAKKREFILPLMEANEASSILEAYREVTQGKNFAGQKKKIVK